MSIININNDFHHYYYHYKTFSEWPKKRIPLKNIRFNTRHKWRSKDYCVSITSNIISGIIVYKVHETVASKRYVLHSIIRNTFTGKMEWRVSCIKVQCFGCFRKLTSKWFDMIIGKAIVVVFFFTKKNVTFDWYKRSILPCDI